MQLIRILLVVIVGVLGLDVKGIQPQASGQTIFDLPADTLGLMDGKQTKAVCGKDKACVHVVVGNARTYELVRSINENNSEVGFNAIADDYQVYFPTDGTQPTTEEAVEYSCANVKNDAITDWYMKMFGVIDKNGGNSNNDDDYVKAGWDNVSASSCRIIKFGASVDDTLVDDPDIPSAQITKKDLFIREFRKIASNPVGRVLLYRIMIEIRRPSINPRKPFLGDDIFGDQYPELIQARNTCRSIILQSGEAFSFNKSQHVISINFNKNRFYPTWVKTNDKYILSRKESCDLDVSIYHEINHWYHFLRNPKRWEEESYNSFRNYPPKVSLSLYYEKLLDINAKYRTIIVFLWCQNFGDKYPDLEEVRNVLGYFPCTANKQVVAGDDLSENLYRYIKYGHNDGLKIGHVVYQAFDNIELDSSVIEKIISDITRIGDLYK